MREFFAKLIAIGTGIAVVLLSLLFAYLQNKTY